MSTQQLVLLVSQEARRSSVAREPSSLDRTAQARTAVPSTARSGRLGRFARRGGVGHRAEPARSA